MLGTEIRVRLAPHECFSLWFPESATTYTIFYPVYVCRKNSQYLFTLKMIRPCVCVSVCVSVVAQPEIHIHEVATEPLNVNGSEIKLLLQQLDR